MARSRQSIDSKSNQSSKRRVDRNRTEDNPKQKKEKQIKKSSNAGRPSKKQKAAEKSEEQQPGDVSSTVPQPSEAMEAIFIDIMGHLAQFFEATGQKKGFVYNRDCRLKLRRSTQRQFTEHPEWHLADEQEKVERSLSNSFYLQEGQMREKLRSVLLETSGIFASQFTEEYYTIVVKAWDCVQRGVNLAELGEDIFRNDEDEYPFFSYQFRSNVRLMNDQFTRPNDSRHYCSLVTAIAQELNKL